MKDRTSFEKNTVAEKLRRFFKKQAVQREIAGFLCAAPVILGILIFTFIPAVQAFIYSFYDFDGFNTFDFIGWKNYEVLFTFDRDTPYIFKNTFLYALINVPLGLILGYFLALLANSKVKGIGIFRTLFYLPCVIPGVASGLLWRDLFNPETGIINQLLSALHLPTSQFFYAASSSMPTLILTTVFTVGGSMVIWLGAFKNIPQTLYEAAQLDGANCFVRLAKITIPLSTPVIFYNLVTGIIGSLQIFSSFIIAGTSGGKGVDNSLYFIAVKIYNTAFVGTRHQLGYASAIGVILFLIIAVFTSVTFLTNKWVYYTDE